MKSIKTDSTIKSIYSKNPSEVAKECPLYVSKISAGFPSPAEDFIEKKLDLNEHLIKHPSATFYVRVSGDSMVGAGINDGDLLVVDRSLDLKDGKVIIAILNGELTVKRYKEMNGKKYLIPENPKYQTIEINAKHPFELWGVVSSVIRKL